MLNYMSVFQCSSGSSFRPFLFSIRARQRSFTLESQVKRYMHEAPVARRKVVAYFYRKAAVDGCRPSIGNFLIDLTMLTFLTESSVYDMNMIPSWGVHFSGTIDSMGNPGPELLKDTRYRCGAAPSHQ
ncbi:hypothetical protein AAC387_Pa02g2705 [Persea americana]